MCESNNFIDREMSGRHNKTAFNHSFPTTTFNSKAEASVPTVFLAISKLKSEQDKLLEEHKRHRVLNRQISKERITSANRQRQNQYFSVVKHSAHMDLEMKKDHQNKQIQQLKLRYSMNMKNREQHKKMIQSIRQSFHQANHQLYQQIRQKKKDNQNLIKTERAKYMQSRVINRMNANQSRDIRRRSIQNFHESRSSERRSSKSQQIAEMIKKSEEKHRIYDIYLTKNSRIKEQKIKHSRLSQSATSEHNPQGTSN